MKRNNYEMAVDRRDKNFALLIDADNISSKYTKYILDEISNYGTVTYKRVYGDLTLSHNKNWQSVMLEYSLIPFQQYNYTTGKSSTDSAMIIDAMDILYSGNVEGFCIVSSDSDFTRLAARLREAGCDVIGMGEKKTPRPFVKACTQFKYLDVISSDKSNEDIQDSESDSVDNTDRHTDKNSDNESQNITPKKKIIATIKKIINDSDFEPDKNGYNMGELNKRILQIHSDFDPRNYGYNRLSVFLDSFPNLTVNKGYVSIVEDDARGNTPKKKTVKNAIETFVQENQGRDGVDIKEIKRFLEKRYNGFDINVYGYSKFSTFLKDLGCLDLELQGKNHNIMVASMRKDQ